MKIVIDIPDEQIEKSLAESKYIHENEGEKGSVNIVLLYTNKKLDKSLPPVTPSRPKGKWIYSEYHTWICSICGNNPLRGTGFVPSKDGMKMQWKYCNVCGAEMGVSDGQI